MFTGGGKKEAPSVNPQNMSLLQAALNVDLNAGKGGGDITIVGESALLPDSGPLGTIADIESSKNQGKISVYVVRGGDTLSQIADMFGVSVNTIRWANDIKKGESINIGQTLIILPVSGIKYTVKRGDTIASIAKDLKSDPADIIQFNDISSSQGLVAGESIIVPNGETPTLADNNYAPSKSGSKPRGTNVPNYSGYYIRPIDGGRKTQGLHGYNGVDLAYSCGSDVYAAASGDVVIAKVSGWNAGYGSYVVISHPNDTQTLYAHLSKVTVSEGWHVAQGQLIGLIGTSGKSTGCHLHFEVRGARNPF